MKYIHLVKGFEAQRREAEVGEARGSRKTQVQHVFWNGTELGWAGGELPRAGTSCHRKVQALTVGGNQSFSDLFQSSVLCSEGRGVL